MNTLSQRIGFWSALLITITFVAWIICFSGIAMTMPLFTWTNPEEYIAFEQQYPQYFQNIAKFFMMLFGPLYLIFLASFYDQTNENKKILIRISLLFGLAFAVTSSMHYFVQLSAVRQNLIQGYYDGLQYFAQANPYSMMTAIDMTGWTLFLGLSSFFFFPVLSGSRLKKIIRYAFLANGICCTLAAIGYVFKIDVLTFLFINLGVGGAIMIISISGMIMFRKERVINRSLLP